MIHFGLRLIMVASLSLIPMEIKFGNLFFSETIKGSVSKNGEIYFTGTTGINNPSISTPNAYQEDNHGWVQAYLENFDNDGKENGARFMVVSTVEVREMLRRLTIMAIYI
jgi:hypothetical protein